MTDMHVYITIYRQLAVSKIYEEYSVQGQITITTDEQLQ